MLYTSIYRHLPSSATSIGSSIIEFLCIFSDVETGRTDGAASAGATKSINTPSAKLVLPLVSFVAAVDVSVRDTLRPSAIM
jgi:hypothetical protein